MNDADWERILEPAAPPFHDLTGNDVQRWERAILQLQLRTPGMGERAAMASVRADLEAGRL